jgi:hypothetical protein
VKKKQKKQFQRGEGVFENDKKMQKKTLTKLQKRPVLTLKSLQGGLVDLADTHVVFLSGLW